MDSSAQARQVLIADLPREGDLAHHTNDGRPTTQVRTDSTESNIPSPNPNPNPDRSETPSFDITSLTAQLAKLNDSLAALGDEARGEPYKNSEEECRGAARDVEALLASLTQRATKKTFLEKSFPCKEREMFRTVGVTHLRVAHVFAGLCRTADGLGEDAERLAGVVEEVKDAFQRERVKRKVLGWQEQNLKAELEWAEEQMSAREADVAKMRFEMAKMAKPPSKSTADAHSPSEDGIHNPASQLKRLKDDREARAEHDVDKVRLEILAASLESVFLARHEDLSADLWKRCEALGEEGERCLAVAERLEKFRESNYGDLVG
ncbi:hypothetical protein CSAL01_11873 [Colletotrichum salicis]|uniref:Uncharacterized protein n=1 Tax=Colletotrichum salicis TaxID=1209931 RepID=A0A135U712_9PEZI|nr:hypothetical protein CSAL01_11873 [Colletotrichum salicis]